MFRRSSRSSSSYGLVLKMMNAVAYALFLGVHVGFTYGGLYNADSGKPTYVTPAPWAFLVWPIIHFLFLGTIIYQFTDKGHKVIIEGLSWWFMILMLLSALYAHLWASHEYLLAFIVSFLLVGFDSTSHDIVREQQDPAHASDLDQLFIHIPFSLYLGWIRVLNCLSGFAAFGVNAYTHPAGNGTKICVVLALCHLHFAAASDALYSPAGSITILSYLWAVFVHQKPERSEFVHDVALVFAVLATIWVFMVVMIRMRRAEREVQIDEERAPLLGGGYVVVKRRMGTLLRVVL